ncbi:hypothetical protein [Corallococcus macrosporus]|uniref:hypothetical protein n=1 Tax=Corallococcus macrosporus TaxID=35 RepID=UPI003D6D5DBE
MDGTVIRAHPHAAGARGQPQKRGADEALVRSQGGSSTKFIVRAEGHGRPIAFALMPGERDESLAFEHVMNRSIVPRIVGPRRPQLCPAAIVGDKGYNHRRVHRGNHAHRIRPVITTRRDQRQLAHFDRKTNSQRNLVKCLIGKTSALSERRCATTSAQSNFSPSSC